MNQFSQTIFEQAEAVIRSAREKGLTIATAESCTGGGIGRALTMAPGSSSVFLGGIIAYANSVKQGVLGVPEAVLAEHGAVSAQVAELMAENVRVLMGTDLAVSATGVAGPGGGTVDKPVGLVYVGIAQKGAATVTAKLQLEHGREAVRDQTIDYLLGRLRSRLG